MKRLLNLIAVMAMVLVALPVGAEIFVNGQPVSSGAGWSQAADCSGVTTQGTGCYNTATKVLCIGDGSNCVAVGGGTRGYLAIDAGGMVPDTSSGLLQFDANPNIFDYLAFDKATEEYALFRWLAPDDWDGSTVKVKFVWSVPSGSTADASKSTDVVWGIACTLTRDGDSADVAYSNAVEVTDSCAAGNPTADATGPVTRVSAASAALTVQGTIVAGSPVYCQVYRKAAAAGDTFDGDAWLHGVKIEYGKTTTSAW